MGWFTRKREPASAPRIEDIWVVCPKCKGHVYKQEWAAANKVCPLCNYHDRLTCFERLALLADSGTFEEFDADIAPVDRLAFVDGKGAYKDKIAETVAKTRMNEAILTGRAKIEAIPVSLGIMDFRFLGGSLSAGCGEKIHLVADYAFRHRLPLIIVSASGGARMHEGILSLMQMAKTSADVQRLKLARIPYISVLTDPTTGGVSASYAMLGHVNLAEPGALIGFAGRRVIEQTIKQKLPDDFQTAEYLVEHGFVDRIVPRKELKSLLATILRYWKS